MTFTFGRPSGESNLWPSDWKQSILPLSYWYWSKSSALVLTWYSNSQKRTLCKSHLQRPKSIKLMAVNWALRKKKGVLGTLTYKTLTLAALSNQNEIIAYFQFWSAIQEIVSMTFRSKVKHFTTELLVLEPKFSSEADLILWFSEDVIVRITFAKA